MKEFISRLKNIFNTYKWLLIPAIPLFLFVGLTIYLFTPQQNQDIVNETKTITPTRSLQQTTTPSIKQTHTPFKIPSASTNEYEYEAEMEIPITSMPGFQKQELLPNNLTKYTLTSPNPTRENIYITQGENIILERKVVPSQLGSKITHYTDIYSAPQRKIVGSSFYGQTAEEYIYADIGLAFIADPQTGNVLETRLFPPMSVEDYITYIRIYE